jgi:hypothetical protein
VLVMRIVDMRVFVFQGQVSMQVRMAFREVQPYSGPHEESGDNQGWRERRTQSHCQGSADKGSQRKVSPRSRRTEVAERQNEQRQTQAVAYEAEEPRSKK